MATQTIDYGSLADQARSSPTAVDYAALADQARQGGASQPGASHPLIPPGAGIEAEPEPQGIGGKIARWTQNVMDDIKYGTDLTGVGTVLKKLGAHGVYDGNSKQVGDYMASLPLGLLRAGKGAAESWDPNTAVQGAKDIVGGTVQAAQMPAAFVAPETGSDAAAGAMEKAAGLIPSAERAGKNFQQVMGAAKDIPINVSAPGDAALQLQRFSESGATLPKVVRDFLKRATDPDKGPITYEEARDFYSNASTKMSPDQAMKLTPNTRRMLGEFTRTLGNSVSEAADQAGKLDQYTSAMKEYHRAMQLRAIGQTVKDAATSTLAKTAAGAVGGGAAGYVAEKLLNSTK